MSARGRFGNDSSGGFLGSEPGRADRTLRRDARSTGAAGAIAPILAVTLGLVILAVLAVALILIVRSDDAAVTVDSDEAAVARQGVIDQAESPAEPASSAVTSEQNGQGGQNSDSDDANSTSAGGSASESGLQADAAASASGSLAGTWSVDTTFGTFDDLCLEEVCQSTFVGFRIDEELAGIGHKTVIGRTPNVEGSFNIEGSTITSAHFEADMTSLVTDSDLRTRALRGARGGLETDTFPVASFSLVQPIELVSEPIEGVTFDVEAVGDLTVHGVTNRVSVPLTAEIQAGVAVVVGRLESLVLDDYDIPKPSAPVVLSVEEHAEMEIQLFLTR